MARLVSLGYSEAMARVALTNEDNSLERAAEALAANNGIVEHQVALRSFFLFSYPTSFYVLGDVTRQLGALPVPLFILFLDCFFVFSSFLFLVQ